MQVPKDLPKRMERTAQAIPRNVIASLLQRLLPREPVKVRPPEGGWKLPDAPGAPQPAPFAKVRAKVRRARAGSNRRYKVLNQHGHLNHRRGSWRHAMVASILACDNEQAAIAYLTETYPKFAAKGVDLNWVATEAGYVELI